MPTALPSLSPAHRILAGVMLAALLSVLGLAVQPAWHEELHCDAHDTEHVCAATLFSHGHVDVSDGFVPITGPSLSPTSRSSPRLIARPTHRTDLLNPVRGPPRPL